MHELQCTVVMQGIHDLQITSSQGWATPDHGETRAHAWVHLCNVIEPELSSLGVSPANLAMPCSPLRNQIKQSTFLLWECASGSHHNCGLQT